MRLWSAERCSGIWFANGTHRSSVEVISLTFDSLLIMSLPTDPNPCYHPKDGGSGSQKVGRVFRKYKSSNLPRSVKIDGTDTKR